MEQVTDRGAGQTEPATEATQLDALALAGAAAILAAVVMLLVGMLGAIGVYQGGVEMMQQWHLFFEPTVLGTIGGMIEAAIATFVFVYALALLYNVFTIQRGTSP